MHNIITILRSLFLSARRDKLFVGMLVLLLLSFALALLMGDLFNIEKAQSTAVFMVSSARMIINLGMVLFTCFSIKRMFDNKEIQFLLATPISRSAFLTAHWLGFLSIALLMILGTTLVLFVLVPINRLGILYWGISLVGELAIVITFALLASLILKSAIFAVMATFGFYFVSRVISCFYISINFAHSLEEFLTLDGSTHTLLRTLGLFFPRLDLFAQSEWLAYGITNYPEFWLSLTQTVIYIPLMLLMSFYDFRRKEF